MAINLKKGQRISLETSDGSKLQQFCVGCNWGSIQCSRKVLGFAMGTEKTDVDLDLSCIMIDAAGKICDHIYSPEYLESFLANYHMPKGKLDSKDRALHHSGDDRKGDTDGNDGLDNEIITVDLSRVSQNVHQIFFFLNNVGKEDFSQIPYASIRMYEGTPLQVRTVYAHYDVAAESNFAGKRALIMGKLYRRNNEWKFAAIGDAHADENLCITISRIAEQYAK